MSLPKLGSYLLSLLCGVALLAASMSTASARELAAEIDEMVEVEIATVGVAGFGGPPVVLLREPGAREVIPIFIGINEAGAILRGLAGERSLRPMTHDLLSNVLGEMEATLERVYVDAIVDHTFLGMLELSLPGRDERIRIDSRPSDAIALAIHAGASIHVAPQVLEAARDIEYEGLDDQVVVALGITVAPVTADLREALGLPDQAGVLVSDVRGPAADAGLEPGALLLEVNGEVPETPLRYLELVRDTAVDEDARLRYWQQGEEHEIEVTTDVPPREPMPRPRQDVPGIRT
ncbi:PDZ domain-containing protein [Halomonas daqingensis]|uniref:bifunctional nuclease domain-containing protein n=1 Tax=Billgrantia desiderata TaxID=52021 RepID=UPI001D7CE89A|nr:bifunctional nuclease domain-containing protein [Halomonas desiderata]MCE8028315.1 PDZ domain-containing protein [Halomonas desiderata]NIC38911.1 PDZ domain-containing protein [Halomonas desiderata]